MLTYLLIAAVLLIGLGILVGSSWTQQALDRRFRQNAAERRALNEEWRAVRELRAELAAHDRAARSGQGCGPGEWARR